MRYPLLGAVILLSLGTPSTGHADDCAAKLTDQQRATYATLSNSSQQILVHFKTRSGAPASCEFRGGMLDILGNYPPEKRDAGFAQLLEKTLAKQK